jgi:tetratricopeptide (TPR) repeat protein
MTNNMDFQQLMDAGNNAAWDQNWTAAIQSYSQAVQIRPEDLEANLNLGLALANAEQFDRALKVFKHANQLAPDDPVAIERTADVMERLGQSQDAAQQYVKASEIYLAQKDLGKAISNWERATQLASGLVSVHARLAQAYERMGNKANAIREYLVMAYHFRRMNDNEKSTRAIERALKLDKGNAQALNALRALQSGGEIVLPDDYLRRKSGKTSTQTIDPFSASIEEVPMEMPASHPLGPIGEALETAMGMLAEHVVESGLNDFVMYALQGMEFQRQELIEKAVNAYREADAAGLRHPSLKMNLGGLLVLANQPEEAISHLKTLMSDPKLAAGALHGLGQAYFKMGKNSEAAHYLIQSLEQVDTNLVMMDDEIAELRKVYASLMGALEGRTDDALQIINERFIGLLSGKDWKQRIAETRRHLDETLRDEGGQGVIDFLIAKGSDDLAEGVYAIDRYIRQGLYTLAMDEAHRAVEKSPFYLPVHVRMAEIMMKEGRIRQAINKFATIAMAYMVRDENDRAASILEEVIEMAPLDVDIRMNLIHLLEQEKRLGEAMDHYISLAETYQQLGDFDRASFTFGVAEQIAQEEGAPPQKIVEIKHFLAEIYQMRLNTRGAQKIFEDILALMPDDQKALRSLIEIYYMLGNQVEAVKRLDMLLGIYAKQGKVQKIVQMLEDLVQTNPSDTALRQRLAQIYRKLGKVREAIEQLDALGELQLDAGLHGEAAKTIKQIISMGPDRLDDYKRLLAQLGESS